MAAYTVHIVSISAVLSLTDPFAPEELRYRPCHLASRPAGTGRLAEGKMLFQMLFLQTV